MHPSGARPAQHDRRLPVEAKPLKLCVAVLAVGLHLADADLVAHHLDRLLAHDDTAEEKGKIKCMSLFTVTFLFFIIIKEMLLLATAEGANAKTTCNNKRVAQQGLSSRVAYGGFTFHFGLI
jgi:hypothetical protein